MTQNEIIDLRTCKKGDILVSSLGVTLQYIAPTPWEGYTYLDHVVKYLIRADGTRFPKNSYGTRTHDGFVFASKRIPETDNDIVKIYHKPRKDDTK